MKIPPVPAADNTMAAARAWIDAAGGNGSGMNETSVKFHIEDRYPGGWDQFHEDAYRAWRQD